MKFQTFLACFPVPALKKQMDYKKSYIFLPINKYRRILF